MVFSAGVHDHRRAAWLGFAFPDGPAFSHRTSAGCTPAKGKRRRGAAIHRRPSTKPSPNRTHSGIVTNPMTDVDTTTRTAVSVSPP